MDPKKLSRINALKAKRLRQCQELILQHNLKVNYPPSRFPEENNPIVTITNPQESEEEIQKKTTDNTIKENGETSQPEITVTCLPDAGIKPAPTIEQQIEAARRQVAMLRTRLERRNVKVSKVADMFIAYCEQYIEYDAFFTPPEWPNPWLSDTTDMWDQEKQCKEPLPLRRVRRWSFSLRELLQDPAGRDHFAKFLNKEFSGENLKFWLAVQDLKALPIRRVSTRAKEIWKEYLAADAPSPINIDAASRELTRQKVESGTADRYCFDQAQAHVYHLMKSDSYSRYLRSEMYKDYLNGSKKKTSVKGIRSIVSFTARKETSTN
uniref:RGS domain-containing protein n=1 Tax=Heliothis virescens TaxID=7102 RepID=A0A2A4JI50_HELVI